MCPVCVIAKDNQLIIKAVSTNQKYNAAKVLDFTLLQSFLKTQNTVQDGITTQGDGGDPPSQETNQVNHVVTETNQTHSEADHNTEVGGVVHTTNTPEPQTLDTHNTANLTTTTNVSSQHSNLAAPPPPHRGAATTTGLLGSRIPCTTAST